MYKCTDCGYVFAHPFVCYDSHHLEAPPYERHLVCPKCHAGGYEPVPVYYCRACGAHLPQGEQEYCNDVCRRRGKAMWEREIKRRHRELCHPLLTVVREIENYNRAHGTRYSYGEYVAFIVGKEQKKH